MPSQKCQQVKGPGVEVGGLTGKRKSWKGRASCRDPGDNRKHPPGNRVSQKLLRKSVGVEKDRKSKINAALTEGQQRQLSLLYCSSEIPTGN